MLQFRLLVYILYFICDLNTNKIQQLNIIFSHNIILKSEVFLVNKNPDTSCQWRTGYKETKYLPGEKIQRFTNKRHTELLRFMRSNKNLLEKFAKYIKCSFETVNKKF